MSSFDESGAVNFDEAISMLDLIQKLLIKDYGFQFGRRFVVPKVQKVKPKCKI